MLPFNWDDAIQAARLDFSTVRNPEDDRQALKDDVKIIAQAIVKDAAYTITDDSNTFYRCARRLYNEGRAGFITIKLGDGFDPSFFNGGQREFLLETDEDAEQEAR